MITRAQIEKLGALHAVEPAMLSLYLATPPFANLIARAGELIAAAGAACGQPLAARDRDWVLEKLPPCARDCPGRTAAVFACAGSGLFEVITLPCPLPERGVLGVRPHIRPLLLALQRGSVPDLASPGVGLVVGLPACLVAVSAGPVQTLVVPDDSLVPGYECGRCGTLSLDADTCCPDWGTAALPVPDVIEEMVSRVLEDGGDVLVASGGSLPGRIGGLRSDCGAEDRPADLGPEIRLAGCVELRDQVVLADRAVDADFAFGHVQAQGTVGLIYVGQGALVHRHGKFGGGNLQHFRPAGRPHGARDGDMRDDLADAEFEERDRIQRGAGPGRAYGRYSQGRVQLAECCLPPGIQVRRRHLFGDGQSWHGTDRPVLDRDRQRRAFEQRPQRRDHRLGERQLSLHPLHVRDDHLVTDRYVGRPEHLPDLLERHAEIPESADHLGGLDLVRRVEAVTGLLVDLGRGEQPDLVVVPQRYHAQVGHPGEITDGQPHPHNGDSRPGCRAPLPCCHHAVALNRCRIQGRTAAARQVRLRRRLIPPTGRAALARRCRSAWAIISRCRSRTFRLVRW